MLWRPLFYFREWFVLLPENFRGAKDAVERRNFLEIVRGGRGQRLRSLGGPRPPTTHSADKCPTTRVNRRANRGRPSVYRRRAGGSGAAAATAKSIQYYYYSPLLLYTKSTADARF